MTSEQGKYVVIEGHDGTGKTTQLDKLASSLQEQDIDIVKMQEPGSTPIADEIRALIKNGSLERDPETNLLLFTAARRESWKQAKRELALGKWVLSARNYFSTLAYQGYGEGINLNVITEITERFTDERYMNPDATVMLHLESHNTRNLRINQREQNNDKDTFESKDTKFQDNVREAYLHIARMRNIEVIDAGLPVDHVAALVLSSLNKQLNNYL